MRRHMLRLLLGLGYVILLTTLLLYQAGVFGERRDWKVAVLGTLVLGVALAAVLALYIRVNDQTKERMREQGSVQAANGAVGDAGKADGAEERQRKSAGGAAENDTYVGNDGFAGTGAEADKCRTELGGERHGLPAKKDGLYGSGKDTADGETWQAPRSYEEVYTHFLTVMESCALSERELEVAWLLYRGYTNRQIGEALFIAETTVKKHVSHIYQKMDVCSRKEFRGKVQAGSPSGG